MQSVLRWILPILHGAVNAIPLILTETGTLKRIFIKRRKTASHITEAADAFAEQLDKSCSPAKG